MKTLIPFALINIENSTIQGRGYTVYPQKINYNPISQTSDLLQFGGPSEPTTMSNCAETTGNWISGYDSDESSDDTGTD